MIDVCVPDLISAACLPSRHKAATGSTQFDPAIVTKLGSACLSEAGIALVVGNRGTGKTQIAVELAIHWCTKRQTGAFYTRAGDLFAAMKREFDAGNAGAMMAKCSAVGLLIIDEMQEVMGTKWEDTELTRLLDHRYADQRPTVLIANAKPEQLVRALGASVMDRIAEAGAIVEMTGASHRRSK